MSDYEAACNCQQAIELTRLLEELVEWYEDHHHDFQTNDLPDELFTLAGNTIEKYNNG